MRFKHNSEELKYDSALFGNYLRFNIFRFICCFQLCHFPVVHSCSFSIHAVVTVVVRAVDRQNPPTEGTSKYYSVAMSRYKNTSVGTHFCVY